MARAQEAMADEHPLGLLALVSSLLAALDAREVHAPGAPTREELVRSFIEIERAETSALLGVLAVMYDEELARARIGRALTRRDPVMPSWVATLRETVAYGALEVRHVLGDGANVILGVRLPEGHELSIVAYLDHNLGTLLKDAFVLPQPLAQFAAYLGERLDDPDTTVEELALADARARLVPAIARAERGPAPPTDTWPASRPLLEWVLRGLPDGGAGYARPVWDDARRAALRARFFASPFGGGLEPLADLLGVVLVLACDLGPGDPLRWSPTAVEIALLDWGPELILADPADLARLPELLAGLVRFAHGERGVRPGLTAQTLAVIGDLEPAFRTALGASALPRGYGAGRATGRDHGATDHGATDHGATDHGATDHGAMDYDAMDYDAMMLALLAARVGGPEALAHLDDRPLPDEPFAWAGVPADVAARVGEVLEACEGCCDALFDPEYKSACRRLLARIAVGDPEVFRRKARADTAAAAICWLVGRANEAFSAQRGGLRAKDLFAHFGIAKGGVAQRAATLARAAGLDPSAYDPTLGSADLLVSACRRRIIDRRDRAGASIAARNRIGAGPGRSAPRR